jgi:hypothetical protein
VADDLIPPPSPAGRPVREPAAREDPPPDAPFGSSPVFADQPGEDEAAVPVSVGASPYRSRFGFIMGALAGLALAAVGLAAIVVAGGGTTSSVPAGWSKWHPTSQDGVAAAREIAIHVGNKYRLAGGDQLVVVQAGPLEIAEVPLSVAIRSAPTGGDIDLIEGDGLLFILNGLGPRGSISKGEPSTQRHLLLRREALELALYSFRYIDGIDQVVTLLPPPPPEKGKENDPAAPPPPTQAIFYRPGDLERQIEAPLSLTIPALTPRPETIPAREKALIETLTRRNLFSSSFTQSQDGRAFLVLDRIPSE